MEIEFLVLSVGVLQFSKFHENEVEHDRDIQRLNFVKLPETVT